MLAGVVGQQHCGHVVPVVVDQVRLERLCSRTKRERCVAMWRGAHRSSRDWTGPTCSRAKLGEFSCRTRTTTTAPLRRRRDDKDVVALRRVSESIRRAARAWESWRVVTRALAGGATCSNERMHRSAAAHVAAPQRRAVGRVCGAVGRSGAEQGLGRAPRHVRCMHCSWRACRSQPAPRFGAGESAPALSITSSSMAMCCTSLHAVTGDRGRRWATWAGAARRRTRTVPPRTTWADSCRRSAQRRTCARGTRGSPVSAGGGDTALARRCRVPPLTAWPARHTGLRMR